MATSTPNSKSVPVPADSTPEYAIKLTDNINQLQEIDSLASNFPGLPDINELASPEDLLSYVTDFIDIPSYMPSINLGGITELASSAASLAGQPPLDAGALLGNATGLITGDFDFESLDPFGLFSIIEQAKNIACNFTIPSITVPDIEAIFNAKINEQEEKFKSLAIKFNGIEGFNVEEFLKKAVKSFEKKITDAFKSLYNKLFTCQSEGDQSA